MFLNFPLDRRIRKYCGIDLTWMSEDGEALWECWNRMAMGMCPSPWVTIRLLMWMMEIVIGNPTDISNPFRWDKVIIIYREIQAMTLVCLEYISGIR